MREIWGYLWKTHPLSLGGFAKFINVDAYPGRFYMGESLVFHGSDKEVDARMSLFLFKQFMLEYYDTIVYDIPQADFSGYGDLEPEDIIISVGVSFPTILLSVMEYSKAKPLLGKFVKALSESALAIGEFMEAMCVVATNYIGLISQDNEIYPVTQKLSEYIIRYLPGGDADLELEAISTTIH